VVNISSSVDSALDEALAHQSLYDLLETEKPEPDKV
jgi:hypothetical protein